MIRIFTGEDRLRANQEITKFLGKDYEIIEGTDLTPADLPSLFRGTTLFADTRRILIRDLSSNKPVFEQLPKYLDTPHDVIIFELKLDKRSSVYKTLKDKVEIKVFDAPPDRTSSQIFDIYRIAKHDARRAISLLEQIKPQQDPFMFFGLIASQALKDYAAHQGITEKKALKELSKLDLSLKSTSIEPWLLIEALLLRLSSL